MTFHCILNYCHTYNSVLRGTEKDGASQVPRDGLEVGKVERLDV